MGTTTALPLPSTPPSPGEVTTPLTSARPQAASRTTTSGRGLRRVPRRGAALVLLLVLVVALVAAARTSLAGPVRIASGSMSPTLDRGDVVLVDRRLDVGELHRGDLVTFTSPEDGRETLKRVVGLPGETVSVQDSRVFVGARELDEPYVDRSHWDAQYTGQVAVPDDAVWLLGDNRGASVDSRVYGPVPLADVDGRVLLRLWPPGR